MPSCPSWRPNEAVKIQRNWDEMTSHITQGNIVIRERTSKRKTEHEFCKFWFNIQKNSSTTALHWLKVNMWIVESNHNSRSNILQLNNLNVNNDDWRRLLKIKRIIVKRWLFVLMEENLFLQTFNRSTSNYSSQISDIDNWQQKS